MTRIVLCALVLGVTAAAGACGASSRPPSSDQEPGLDAGNPPGPEGGSPGDGGKAEGATGSDGGDGSTGDEGGGDDSGPDGKVSIAICREGYTWSTIAQVTSIGSSGFDRFGSVSADELTVAWSDAAGDVFYADRTSATGDFGAPAQLDPGTTQLANDRVALSPDGLELIATLADGSSFASFARQSRGAAWGPNVTIPDQFANVKSILSESGGALANPVVSADHSSFFYLASVGKALPVPCESTWDDTTLQWSFSNDLPGAEFATSGAQVRRPTGASSDDRTLFFFDEVAGHERAAWRNTPTSAFDEFADLPELPEAVPSGDCIAVYFRATDDAGAGLYTGSGP